MRIIVVFEDLIFTDDQLFMKQRKITSLKVFNLFPLPVHILYHCYNDIIMTLTMTTSAQERKFYDLNKL